MKLQKFLTLTITASLIAASTAPTLAKADDYVDLCKGLPTHSEIMSCYDKSIKEHQEAADNYLFLEGFSSGIATVAVGFLAHSLWGLYVTRNALLGGVVAPINLIKSQMKLTNGGGNNDNGASLAPRSKPGDEKLASAIDTEAPMKTVSLPGDIKGQPVNAPKEGAKLSI